MVSSGSPGRPRPSSGGAADSGRSGAAYTVVDLPGGDPVYGGECLATRCPVVRVHSLDRPLSGPRRGSRAQAVAVEYLGPGAIGPVLVVHHKGTFELDLEQVREQQALATARFVEDLLIDRPQLPAVLLGDFNAGPDTGSIRFLTGRQSLDGISFRYEGAWEAVHGDRWCLGQRPLRSAGGPAGTGAHVW